ncbi:MAG: hypothetical protein M1827_002456 [Pycnora praestabilis]|nr:MAG: hypothetical protein M1827_002456 [Pycnora praestabilis]
MPFPDALKGHPKCIFFTDFDGTITLKDSNDYITDNLGFGLEKRRQGNIVVLEGKASFRDEFRKMIDSINAPFPECVKLLLENIKLDPYFKEFYTWSRENNVPVIVLSSGMTDVIRALLVKLVGPEANDIEIICNECVDRPGKNRNEAGGWEIKFHDDSHFGHDKSLTIRPYAERIAKMPENERPTLLYAGDGVSDLSAAQETDLLFAKKGHDLVTFCEKEGMPFTVFEDWKSILATTKDINSGKTSVKKVAAEGAEAFKKESSEVKTTK